jgi:outer membrane protein assembly factor BamA
VDFDLPLNLSGGFFQRQQDSIFVRRTIDLRTEVPFFDVFSVAATVHREEIIPSGSLALTPVGRSKMLLAGLELLYDTRDDPVSPEGGVRYRATYQTGSKKIETQPSGAPALPEQSTVQKIGIDAEFYFATVAKQVGAITMHGRQITTDNLESGDYYRFGGATTLRGYRENQFQGSTVAWTNTEYRFLLARRSFLYGFFDTGFYLIPADDARGIASSQAFLFGYGFGFRLATSLGNIGVSIALGKGDPPSQAKLHIALMNEF